MTTTLAATPIPVRFGLGVVTDHLSTVLSRPAPVPRRIDFFWGTFQPTNPGAGSQTAPGQNDTWDHSFLDTLHTLAAAAEITHICGCLSYTPAWAGGSGDGHQIPRDASNGCRDYANISRLITWYWHNQGYDVDVTLYLEAWNEPQNGFMGSNTPALITAYQKLLVARADACRNGNILGRTGVLAHYTSGGDLWTGGTGAFPVFSTPYGHLGWHKAIIDNDPDCFDHIAIHDYSGGCPLGTNNGFDPGHNVHGALKSYLVANRRPDAQINNTEAGWNWRLDGTPDASDCGTQCNCNSYGSGGGQAATEVQVSVMAARIAALETTWPALPGAGMYFLFQQDTTSTTDGLNHAGLYDFSANRTGAAVLDSHGNPAPLNAFLALVGGSTADTTKPAITFISPSATVPVRGVFAIAAGVTDKKDDGTTGTVDSAITVRLSHDGGATFPVTPTYTPAGAPFGYNQIENGIDSTNGDWPDGSYTAAMKATDQHGNTRTVTRTFTVDNSSGGIPTVASVTPNSGSVLGGTVVGIAGTGFAGVVGPGSVRVKIAGGAGANVVSYTVVDDTHITATMPPVPQAAAGGTHPSGVDFGAAFPSHTDIDNAVGAGFAAVRIAVQWDAHDPNFTGIAANLSRVDDIIQYCNARTLLPGVTPVPGSPGGIAVCLQFAIGPQWGDVGTAGHGQLYNEHGSFRGTTINVPRRAAEFGASIVDHYKPVRANGTVWVYEVYNEPNHQKADDGVLSGVDVDHKGFAYVKLIAHFSRLARAADPACKIALGGLGGEHDDDNDVSAHTFTQQLYDAAPTAAQSYDGIAIPNGIRGLVDFWNDHPYEYYDTPSQGIAKYIAGTQRNPPNYDQGRGFPEMLFHVWPILDANGDSALTVLGTEFGQPSPATVDGHTYTIQDAANAWVDVVGLIATLPHPFIPFWFQMYDNAKNGDGVTSKFFGIYTQQGVKKQPLWQTVHDINVGTYNANVTNDATPTSVTVDMIVENPTGPSQIANGDRFTYTTNPSTVPTITQITPANGTSAGGTPVTITGTHFTGTDPVAGVKIGGVACTNVVVVDDSHITAHTPAHVVGQFHTKVTNATDTSVPTDVDQFTFANPAAVVTAVAPPTGPAATSVVITGTGFTPVTAVIFGTTPATSFHVDSATQITAVAPAHADGTVDITVLVGTVPSSSSPADHFTYAIVIAPAPTITQVTPNSGDLAGGTSIIIDGTNLGTVTDVRVGAASIPFDLNTPTAGRITATTLPRATAATLNVTVTNPSGDSPHTNASRFTYTSVSPPSAPTVTDVEPDSGTQLGGTTVVITGTHFDDVIAGDPTAVQFDSTNATSFHIDSSTQITAVAPPMTAGTVDITIASPNGRSGIVPEDAYTYPGPPTVTHVSPAHGAPVGGTATTITGTNFS